MSGIVNKIKGEAHHAKHEVEHALPGTHGHAGHHGGLPGTHSTHVPGTTHGHMPGTHGHHGSALGTGHGNPVSQAVNKAEHAAHDLKHKAANAVHGHH